MRSLDSSKRDPVFKIGLMIVCLTLVMTAGFLLLYFKSELDVKQIGDEIGIIRGQLENKVIHLPGYKPGMTTEEFQRATKGGGDTLPSLTYQGTSVWLGMDIDTVATKDGEWDVVQEGKKIGWIACPAPETGWEGWDIKTEANRSYVKNGKTQYAGKRIMKTIDEPQEGNMALVWGGASDPQIFGGSGCLVSIDLSSPPTEYELNRVDTVYETIQ